VGSRSHAARLAGALLGELLYEAGELDDAARMLEMSYGLGPDGGGVDYLAARYVGSAKVKAAQGDLSAAAERLDAGMKQQRTCNARGWPPRSTTSGFGWGSHRRWQAPPIGPGHSA
jgi:ATP/maltotriose-dependent transcriptional regulator MalT